MSIISLKKLLDFCDVEKGYFVINAANDILKLAYDGGGVTDIDIADGTYEGSGLATELQSKIDTAFSISSTVSYSSTTKKFTIDVGMGHTVAYTNLDSDAGLTLGFDQNHSAAQIITSDLSAGDPSSILESIRDGVEDWVADKCRRTFESTDYSEYYDGDGGCYLNLKNYPIISLTRVCIGRRYIIRVKNTSEHTSATVSVTSTGLVFTKDDTSDSTIIFADYATMGEVVTAINALGSGWFAAIESSDFSNFKSSELVRTFGKNAIDGNWIYLEAPDEAIDDFEVNPDKGTLYYSLGWPEGENNIFVKFTAGYSTMPDRLKLAVKIACKSIYQKRKEELFNVKEYSIGGREGIKIIQIPGMLLSKK
jgi:hypothetical protein